MASNYERNDHADGEAHDDLNLTTVQAEELNQVPRDSGMHAGGVLTPELLHPSATGQRKTGADVFYRSPNQKALMMQD